MLKPDPNVVVAEADGRPMLLHVGTWTYLSFNEVGGRIWRHLSDTDDRDEIVARLSEEFDGEPAQIRADVDRFLEKLKSEGFVTTA